MNQEKAAILQQKVTAVRALRPLSNCYSADVINKVDEIWEEDESFLFSYNDHGVNRLNYYVTDLAKLDKLLGQIRTGTYYLEFMTKDPNAYHPEGTEKRAGLMRLANSDCRSIFNDSGVMQYYDPSVGEQAKESDATDINRILWSVFHTEISHLLTDYEMRQVIDAGQMTIHRGISEIDAILQTDVMPRKFYINQVINRTDRSVIHAMLLNRLKQYIDQGGKYLYAWVEDNNIASRKFHAKYGMQHDGMWNMLYKLEKQG